MSVQGGGLHQLKWSAGWAEAATGAASCALTYVYVDKFRKLGLLVILGAALSLGGCTLGPDFVTPEVPEPASWVEPDEADEGRISSKTGDLSTWWEVFDDPVLSELVKRSASQNLTLQVAGLRILEARARVGIAAGNQFPQIQDVTAGYSRNVISNNAPNANVIDRNYDDLFTGFDAAWELDFWGRFRRGVESADAGLAAEVATYDDLLVSLTAEVATTYVLIRELQERLRLASDNVALQQRTLEITDVRFRAGEVTELDVQQARTLLRGTQALIPVLETSLRQAQNALSVLLGVPPYNLSNDIGGVMPIPAPPLEVAVGVPAELLRRRPDIRRAEYLAAAQSAQIGVAKSDLYPAFTLAGFIGFETSGAGGSVFSNGADLTDIFDADSFTATVGPSVRWPILNYGRLTNNVRVQDARFQALAVSYENTVLEAYREAEDGLVAFVRAEERTEFLLDSVAASERSVELALLQYREGLSDYIRVLDTQRSLVAEQDRLAETQGAVSRNLIAVYKALGGGWEIRGEGDIVPRETLLEMQERTDWGELLPPEVEETPPEDDALIPVRWPDW